MIIPGYDDWKLRTPEEDHEMNGGRVCEICGAYSPRSCEMKDEMDGICPLEECEPDVDYLRDLRADE